MDFPDGCPVCGGHNGGRGTCAPCNQTVKTFRQLIRHLQEWRASYEADSELETLPGPDGREWLLWDVERFYSYRTLLPEQQKRCIELFLFQNCFERQTAELMGVGRNGGHTSVAIYATVGLIKLLSLARAGDLPGCDFEFEVDRVLIPERTIIQIIQPLEFVPKISVKMRYLISGAPVVIEYPLYAEMTPS